MKKILVFVSLLILTYAQQSDKNVFCYYDSRSANREALAKIKIPRDLEDAVPLCSHLVYGYAKISDDNQLAPLDENVDVENNNYNAFIKLANDNSVLPILSIGGDADTENPEKYISLLQSNSDRSSFVDSVADMLDQYSFSGIDIAWQFPKTDLTQKKQKRSGHGSVGFGGGAGVVGGITSNAGSVAGGVTGGLSFGGGYSGSRNSKQGSQDLRVCFTKLIYELRDVLGNDRFISVTVLPNVDSETYFDVAAINEVVNLVNLAAFDYYTPESSPYTASYAAPIYKGPNGSTSGTADLLVSYWLNSGAEKSKLLLGIPTYARTWKLTRNTRRTAPPPVQANGPGEPGFLIKTPGTYAYPEVCLYTSYSSRKSPYYLKQVNDTSSGSYGYRLATQTNDYKGLWMSHMTTTYAQQRASYAVEKDLGGVSIMDLTLDDVHALCQGKPRTKFPILQAASDTVFFLN